MLVRKIQSPRVYVVGAETRGTALPHFFRYPDFMPNILFILDYWGRTLGVGIEDGEQEGRAHCPLPQISDKNIFRENVMQNSGILLIIHTYIFRQKCLPPKHTELLRL